MIKHLKNLTFAGFAVLALAFGANATAYANQYVGGDLTLSADDPGDVRFLAANVEGSVRAGGDLAGMAADVSLVLSVDGDVELLGADIDLSGEVVGDVALAGADITLNLVIGEDLNAAGADVVVLGRVDGRANLGGALVSIEADASIGEKAEIAGREIRVDGQLEGGALMRGREIYVNGTIEGPVEIRAYEVQFGDNAVISGPMTVYSEISPEIGAAQLGEVEFIEADWDEDSIEGFEDLDIDLDLGFLPSAWAIGGVFAASAFLLGLIVVLLTPRSAARIAACFRDRPLVSGFLGLIVLAILPILVLTLFVLLAITVIGIPLAFLLFFAYPIVMFLAFAFGGMVIGDLALNHSGGDAGLGLRIGSFFAAFLLIAVLSAVPVLGFVIGPIVLCVGLGAWTLALFQRKNGVSQGAESAA